MTPQELKTSVLQYAIQGRLTKQDANDLSLNSLLSTIDADTEVPYDIPVSWKWFRLEDIATLYNGRAYKKHEMLTKGKYPLLRVGNLFTNDSWYYSDFELEPEKYCECGDLLYAWSASFGPHIWKGEKVIYHYHIWKVELKNPDMRDYLYWALEAQTQALKKSAHGSTMIHITKANTEKMMIPLPPLAEQKRIVAKLEEILPLIDRYEAARNKLEEFNKRFPVDMQKSILQLVIQGKLVEQRPDEGTGEELFQQIQAEKQALIKAGKIKKEKPLPEITEDEIPFDIPDSWKWVRLLEVIDVRDGTHDTPGYLSSGYPLITGKDFYYGYFDLTKTQYISEADYLAISQRSKVDPYDILFSMIGGNIGSMILITPENYFDMAIKNVALFKQYFRNDVLPKYLFYFLKAQVDQMKASAKGGAQMFVSLKMLRNYPFPLPPLDEQKRIVAKLEEILPLCERLK